MSQTLSQVLAVGAGAAAVAVAAVAVWYYAPGPWREDGPSAIDLALQRRQELAAQYVEQQPRPAPRVQTIAPATATATAAGPVHRRGCDFAPVLRRGSPEDGQFSASAAAGLRGLPEAEAFVSVARDAAAHGRSRDAEAAFVMACRLQSRQAPGSESLADVERALARHYVDVAQQETSPDLRALALGRARDLLAEAARIYGGTLGPQAMKTRDSEQALRAVAAGADSALEVDTASAARVDSLAVAPREARPRSEPRRQEPEALVAGDAELAQLESDLQRLRSQAESVSGDPAGLRQRAADARARRRQCADRECLQRWYAQRRRSLLNEF